MAYITVWDGIVNMSYIQVVLSYGWRESVDIIGCYFIKDVQKRVIYQDR